MGAWFAVECVTTRLVPSETPTIVNVSQGATGFASRNDASCHVGVPSCDVG